jgi:uncharacterized protein YecE (DUF72 family)
MSISNYHLGCPIWANKDWVGELFRSKTTTRDFLRQYASVFNSVEGNATFYGLPSQDTVARWKEETPDGFRFCFKFPRTVSHDLKLVGAQEPTLEFLDRLGPLDDRLGPFFLQLPPSYGPNLLPGLEQFLRNLPTHFRYAVEVRHPEFFGKGQTQLDNLLAELGVDRVVFDTRGLHGAQTEDPAAQEAQRKKPNVPVNFLATASCPFIRFVGHPEVDENLPLLEEWAGVTAGWIAEGKTPYIFMHAPDDFYAPRLARHFHRLLSAKIDVAQLPEFPGEEAESAQEQLSLF